ADFNGDGLEDVFIANDTERNFLYLNKGDGRFDESGLSLGIAYNDDGTIVSGMGADAKDFDNDGQVDVVYNDLKGQIFGLFKNLVVTSLNEPPRILLSSGTPARHWLMVETVGTRSNRDAIGANVKVVTGSGRKLYNHVTMAQGFLSSADKRVHFGLGAEQVVE